MCPTRTSTSSGRALDGGECGCSVAIMEDLFYCECDPSIGRTLEGHLGHQRAKHCFAYTARDNELARIRTAHAQAVQQGEAASRMENEREKLADAFGTHLVRILVQHGTTLQYDHGLSEAARRFIRTAFLRDVLGAQQRLVTELLQQHGHVSAQEMGALLERVNGAVDTLAQPHFGREP